MLLADNEAVPGEFVLKLTSRRFFRGDLRDSSLWCKFRNGILRMTLSAWADQMYEDYPQVMLEQHISSNIGVRTTILLLLCFNAQHVADGTSLWRDGVCDCWHSQ